MKNLKFLLSLFVVAFLLVPATLFAQEGEVDFGSATSVIEWLMPIITLGVTWLVKKIAPFVQGTVTLFVVPLVSAGIGYLATLIDADASFLVSFLAGLGSVFLNQFYRSITES